MIRGDSGGEGQATLPTTVPSTKPQLEVWTSSKSGTDANLANTESVCVKLTGPLDTAAFETALTQLLKRHESLRSTFSADGLTRVVNASAALKLERLDFVGTPEKLEALKVQVVSEPFDLENGPLCRVQLVKLGAQEHVFVLTAHHIICDSGSTAVLISDLARLYSGTALPPSGTFVAWTRDLEARHGSADGKGDERYWVGQLTGDLPVPELPTDRPRPVLRTYPSMREDSVLGEDLIRALKESCAKENASLFAVLLAGFKALLFHLTGQDDVIVGIPSAGQSIGGHEGLVGLCMNILPLRTRASADAMLSAFVADVRRTLLDGTTHKLYAMGSLLAKVPVGVIFNFERGLAPESMPFKGLTASFEANTRRFATYDISLNAVELGGTVKLECQFNTDLFDASTIRRWLAGYERLLRSFADGLENGTGRLGELELVSPAERAQLEAWNQASALEVDSKLTVVELLEAQAAKTPQRVAVEQVGKQLTYAQLDARSNAIAARLRSLGVARGALVGLCVERSVDMVAGLWGVLKAGAGYVPLDPGYPAERLAFMVQDSGLQVLLTQASVASELKLSAQQTVSLEDIAADAPRAASGARPEDVCYVIYTSGSTGKPKGVLLPHRAVVNFLKSMQREPGLKASDSLLAVTTLSFDIAVLELYLPLITGARVVLASREDAADGARLLTLLNGVTVMQATPASWRLLLEAGWQGSPSFTALIGGEALPLDVAKTLASKVGALWNMYGPTETCVWSTLWRVPPNPRRVLIGKPIANTQCHVLDAQRRPVPIGVVGELSIAGAGLALGYHQRPELTAARFVDGRYRTGDLARWLADGTLECLGRNDSQVKLRGYRIELGEIEEALNQHPSVRQAAVVLREVKPGDPRLLGYLVTHSGRTVTDAELRTHLKKTLPDYMLPQHIVRLERMPLSPAGKIDRKALPPFEPRQGPDVGRLRRSAQRHRREAVRHLGPRARRRARRCPRQLLRPGRALADGDEAVGADADGVQRDGTVARSLRGADGGAVCTAGG